MAEEKTTNKEVKKEGKETKVTTGESKETAEKPEDKKVETEKKKTIETKEVKKEESKEKPKSKKSAVKIEKKEKAIANAFSVSISPKHSKYICKMIRRKDPDTALIMLEKIAKKKLPVKMTGLEVPHQRGKGIAGARFPITAAKEIANVVKQLKANAVVNGIEEPIITIAMSNKASSPLRRGGRQAKRTHIRIEAEEKSKLVTRKK